MGNYEKLFEIFGLRYTRIAATYLQQRNKMCRHFWNFNKIWMWQPLLLLLVLYHHHYLAGLICLYVYVSNGFWKYSTTLVVDRCTYICMRLGTSLYYFFALFNIVIIIIIKPTNHQENRSCLVRFQVNAICLLFLVGLLYSTVGFPVEFILLYPVCLFFMTDAMVISNVCMNVRVSGLSLSAFLNNFLQFCTHFLIL